MWLIANGAPKSGSTWLFQLCEATGCFSPLPGSDLDAGWSNSSVKDDKVAASIELLADSGRRHVTKQHWTAGIAKEEPAVAAILAHPNIRMLNIVRDLRDMIVSRYHHDVNGKRFSGSISEFLPGNASKYIRQYVLYQKYWIETPFRSPDNYYLTSYEYLTCDPAVATDGLFDFIGGIPTDARARSVEANRFEKKSAGTGSRFFRKGKIFAFGDEISRNEELEILRIAESFGYKDVKASLAEAFPHLKAYLALTDVSI
jgi:hypothetical protein